jgi:hypothetical protein
VRPVRSRVRSAGGGRLLLRRFAASIASITFSETSAPLSATSARGDTSKRVVRRNRREDRGFAELCLGHGAHVILSTPAGAFRAPGGGRSGSTALA